MNSEEKKMMRILAWAKGRGRKLEEPDDSRLTSERLAVAGVSRRWYESAWSYIPDETPWKSQVLQYVEDLNKHRRDGEGLFLMGPPRTGKTSVASLLCKEVIRRDGYPKFVQARSLVDIHLDKDADMKRNLQIAAFIVIDDIGDVGANRLQRDVFEAILRDRDAEMLPTIITTNLDTKQLNESYGEACIALIQDRCQVIPFGV